MPTVLFAHKGRERSDTRRRDIVVRRSTRARRKLAYRLRLAHPAILA
jgi:hypothetical protein